MKARIEVVKGAPPQTFRLAAGRVCVIGRSKNASLQILAGPISRNHCKLQFTGKVWVLTDLESRNGTWMGEARVRSRALRDGDVFSLGRQVFVRFRLEEEKGVVEEAPVDAPSAASAAPAGEAEPCGFCGEDVFAGAQSIKGTDGKVFHEDCHAFSRMIGREVGDVKVIERLGGMRPCHRLRAHQPSLNRHVLLFGFDRRVTGEENFREKLLAEVRAVSRLLHPKILQIHDLAESGEMSLVVTELFPGRTLEEVLGKQAFVKVPGALNIVSQIVDGMAYAETQDYFTDRLSPRDVYVTEENQAKLDLFRPPLPPARDVGTAVYLSPELVSAGGLRGAKVEERSAAVRSAVYSVGAIFYHMLAGIPPFEGNTVEEVMPKILQKTPPALGRVNLKVSPALARVVERAMEKNPQSRPADFRAFQNDLRKIVSPGL